MSDDPIIEILPKSRLIQVVATFDFVLPETASTDEIEEWVRFELGLEPSLNCSNALESEGLDIALRGEVLLTDTGLHSHPSVAPSDKPNNYRITTRYESEPYVGPTEHEQIVALRKDEKDNNS